MATSLLLVGFRLLFLLLLDSGEAKAPTACENENFTVTVDPTQEGKIEICVSGAIKSRDFPKLKIDGSYINSTASNSKYTFSASSNEDCLYITIYVNNITEQDYGDKKIKIKVIVSTERSYHVEVGLPLPAGHLINDGIKFALNGATYSKDDRTVNVDMNTKITLICKFGDDQKTGKLAIKKNTTMLISSYEANSIEYIINNVDCTHIDTYFCEAGNISTLIVLFVNKCELRGCEDNNKRLFPSMAEPGGNGSWEICVVGCASSENFPVLKIDRNYVFETTRNFKYSFDLKEKEDGSVKSIITLHIHNITEEDYGNKSVEILFSADAQLKLSLSLQNNEDRISTSRHVKISDAKRVIETETTTEVTKKEAATDNESQLLTFVVATISVGVCFGAITIIFVVFMKRRNRTNRANKMTTTKLNYEPHSIYDLFENGKDVCLSNNSVDAISAQIDQRVIHPLLEDSAQKVHDGAFMWRQAAAEENSSQKNASVLAKVYT